MSDECVLLLSGGLDSIVLLHYLKWLGYTVYGLMFNYGQKHEKELDCGIYWADDMCEDYYIIDISEISNLINNNALIGNKELSGNVKIL